MSMPQSRFSKFVNAFAAHWFSAVSGAVSVPFTVIALFLSGRWQKTLFGALAVTAGIAASYSVWSQKQSESENLTNELELEKGRNARPLLLATIERVAVVVARDHSPNTTCDADIFVEAVLFNESACPTTVRSYGLVIEDANGKHEAALFGGTSKWIIRNAPVVQDSSGGVVYDDHETLNDLSEDTATQPVVLGVHRKGWLHFRVADVIAEHAEQGRFHLSAIDAFNKVHALGSRERAPLVSGRMYKYLTER